jgi:putative Holliday junction resolvase
MYDKFMRILGIDYGERKVGIALGDTTTRIASPWMILNNSGHGDVIKQIKLVIENEGVDRVVVGIPHDTRDLSQESKQAKAVRVFISDLRSFNIAVDEVDEMMSTAEAQHSMHASGSKAEDDAVAAAIILQSYLDRKK